MPTCITNSRLVSPSNADIMTAEHLLQHCQLHDALRRDMWPEPKPLRDKFCGSLEELKRAATFFFFLGGGNGHLHLVYKEEEEVLLYGFETWRMA